MVAGAVLAAMVAGGSAAGAADRPAAGEVKPRLALPQQPELAGGFVPTTPTRLLDTREGVGTEGVSGPIGQSPLVLDVSGVSGNPSVKPTAVVLNVTVTEPTSGGYLTVYPWGGSRPGTSNLNFRAGETIPNLVTVPVGTDGKVALYNAGGRSHVIADLAGYYTTDRPAATYVANGPTRLLDTREGTGTGGVKAPVGAGKAVSLKVGGASGIPANAKAVTLNVTVTGPTNGGFLTVYPTGQARPTASNLNFVKDQTIPNLVTVPVGADGKVDFFNAAGNTDVIADLAGYYLDDAPKTGGVLQTLSSPTRLLDTREGTGTGGVKAPVGPGKAVSLKVGGASGIPANAKAVTLNVTVTGPTNGGFLTVYPTGQARPTASNLNFVKDQTIPNLVTVPVGADGKVDFFNAAGNTDVIADAFGYYVAGDHLGLADLKFSAATVDASADVAGVDLGWTVTDSDAAAAQTGGSVVIRQQGATADSYVGQAYTIDFLHGQSLWNGATYVSGDPASSSYSYHFYVPRYAGSTSAKWVVSLVSLFDSEGQRQVLAGSALDPSGRSVTANTQVPSALPGYSGVSNFLNTVDDVRYVYNGSTSLLHYRVDAQDQQSGVWQGTVEATGPGGRTLRGSFEEMSYQGQQYSPCQHDIHYATCDVYIPLPDTAPAGVWKVSKVTLTNNAGQTKTYSGLQDLPITVTGNQTVTVAGLAASATEVDNWRQDAPFKVLTKVAGAQNGVSSIRVLFSNMGGSCVQNSTTPSQQPDGSYSVPATMYRTYGNGGYTCQVNGLVVKDGAGHVSVYGSAFFAPELDLKVSSTKVTAAPVVKSAALSKTTMPKSQLGNWSYVTYVQVEPGVAPVTGDSAYLYDSTGKEIYQSFGGTSEGPDGKVSVGFPVPYGLAVGTYTVGFSVSNSAGLTSYWGMPGKPAVPGGPLVFTVTEG
ncbi:hypothetical protein GCM10009664_37570 [Kitasatospora gansuensis]